MIRKLFSDRLQDARLSLWELGDLLGIHPHDLRGASDNLLDQPVRVLLELARQLDLHPADIISELAPLLALPRLTHRAAAHQPQPEPDPRDDHDAQALLAVLASTSVPLPADDLATVLGWRLDRLHDVIQHALAHPDLAGPIALRRTATDAWTITARHDLLTPAQRSSLLDAVHHHVPLTEEEANVLLGALTRGNTDTYATWRQDHLEAEHDLKVSGLLHSPNGPHHVEVHPDVRYSLDLRRDAPDAPALHTTSPLDTPLRLHRAPDVSATAPQ